MTVEDLVRLIAVSAQHSSLYHFTDEANLPSINEHGLLSKEQLRVRGLWPPARMGGNDLSRSLDLHRGIDPYVSLCMTRNHGMMHLAQQDGRLPNPVYLGIKPEVLQIPGTRIAFGVANANNVEIVPVQDAVDRLDTQILYTRMDWTDPAINARLRAAEKFEVLVPKAVPRDMIIGRC